MTCRISVIIPTLNEAANLPATLASVAEADQRLVIDGGSTDTTAEAASIADHFILSERGRAKQLNCGGHEADGDVLLFLHADTQLSPGAIEELRLAMQQPDLIGGAFRMQINSPSRAVRALAWFVNMRSKWLRLPYGDQAIFIRRSLFEQLGGYADVPIAEDVDLIKRMKRHGRITLLRSTAITSGRRWDQRGLIKTTAANLLAITAFQIGVSPHRIRRMYDWLAG